MDNNNSSNDRTANKEKKGNNDIPSPLYRESNLMDSKIRKTLQEKDYTISKETKQIYEKEEKDLREFFSELKAPVKEDPTLVSI